MPQRPMSQRTYPITGIPLVGSGPLPTRKEITSWYNDKETNKYQISLFIQAMQKFKETPIEEQLSFFQIAGIHCYPLVTWDGVAPVTASDPNPGDPLPGYCNHNMVTFPNWHRPYVLLFEQVLYQIMLTLIDTWKKKGTLTNKQEEQLWRSGADQWRLPYWDWARKTEYEGPSMMPVFAIPQVCTLNAVEIILPGGELNRAFPNPLTGFQNPNMVPMGDPSMGKNAIKDDGDLPWSKCIGTSRFGINTDKPESTWIKGVNDWKQVNEAMADPLWYGQGSGSFAEVVSRMLSPGYFDSYESFSSTAHNSPTAKNATNFLSLEYIHNIVHNTTGGTYKSLKDVPPTAPGYKGVGLGHMSDVPVAGFDPIFWFHHCNIDRLAAIWQTLNPNMWFDKPQKLDPSPDSALLPFHLDQNANAWTPNKCRDWTTMNYQYDDLVPQAGANNPDGTVNQERYLQDLRVHLDKLYPSTSTAVRDIPGYLSRDNKFDDYVINVIYDRYALNGSAYAILFFLGDPPQNLSGYRDHENFVGNVYTFSTPIVDENGNANCGNCADQRATKVLSKAQVPLTLPLLAKLSTHPATGATPVGSVDPATVELILRRLLQWKFVQLGGTERPAGDFPNTEIAVLRGEGSTSVPSENTRGGTRGYRGYKKLRNATRDNQLGYGHPRTSLGLIRDDEE